MPIGKARRSLGNESLIIDIAAGESAASPTPTPIRARNSCGKLAASPQAAVATHQNPAPTPISRRREMRSASQPSGRPIAA